MTQRFEELVSTEIYYLYSALLKECQNTYSIPKTILFVKFQKSQHSINGYLKVQTNYVIKYPTLASFLPAHAASPEGAFVCILDCVCVYFLNLFLHPYKQCMYNIIKIIVS